MKRRRIVNPFFSDVPSAKRRKIEILEIHDSDIFTAYSWGEGICALFPFGVLKETKPRLIEDLEEKFDIRTYRMLRSGVGVIFDVQGKVYSFGIGSYGALGLGSEANVLKPERIETLADVQIVQVCGKVGTFSLHTLFLSSRGEVFGCGNNETLEAIGREQLDGSVKVLIPLRVDLSGESKVEISCSSFGSGAVNSSRTRISCWGSSIHGTLGRRLNGAHFAGPGGMEGPIQHEFRIDAFRLGGWHGMALTTSDEGSRHQKLWLWGSNGCNQHGIGSEDNEEHPIAIVLPFFENLRIEKIACGDRSSSCITTDGILFMWGNYLSYVDQ